MEKAISEVAERKPAPKSAFGSYGNAGGLGGPAQAPGPQAGSAGAFGYPAQAPHRMPQPSNQWGLGASQWAPKPRGPPAANAAPSTAPTGPAAPRAPSGPTVMEFDRRMKHLQVYKLSSIRRAEGIDWRRAAIQAHQLNGNQIGEAIDHA